MTFRHLCLFKIIRSLVVFIIVALGEFGLFVFISHSNLLVEYILCLNSYVLSSFLLKSYLYLPSYHPLLLFLFVCVSLSLFFPLTFLIDTKRHAVCANALVALSRFVCSVLGAVRFRFARF